MKIRGAKKVHYDSGPNMTPLVDVVMVILIFLMLAGSFGGTTHYLLSKGGIQGKGGKQVKHPPGFVPPINLDLRIQNNSQGPGFVALINNADPTSDPDELAAKLASKYQAFIGTHQDPANLQVVLYPGQHVHYEYIVQVYQAALKAQFQKVAFATTG